MNGRPWRGRTVGDRKRSTSSYPSRPNSRYAGSRRGNVPPATAQRNYERYLALAREAALKGDTIEMENYYQHAEHYFRVMKAAGATDEG